MHCNERRLFLKKDNFRYSHRFHGDEIFTLQKGIFCFPFSKNQKFHTCLDSNSFSSSTHILSAGILQNANKFSISAQPFTDSFATAAMFENLPFINDRWSIHINLSSSYPVLRG